MKHYFLISLFLAGLPFSSAFCEKSNNMKDTPPACDCESDPTCSDCDESKKKAVTARLQK